MSLRIQRQEIVLTHQILSIGKKSEDEATQHSAAATGAKRQDLLGMCSDLQKMTMLLLNEQDKGSEARHQAFHKPQTFFLGNKYVQLTLDDCLGYLQDIENVLTQIESSNQINKVQELAKILKYTGFLSHKLNAAHGQIFLPNYCRERALKKAMHNQSKQCFEIRKG